MNTLVTALPVSWQPRAKALAALVWITLTVVSTTLSSVPVWVTVVLGVLTFAGVYFTPAPGYVAPVGKHRE